MSQLALPLKLDDHAVFDSFLSVGNETLVAFLADLVAHTAAPGCWLWGARATGKTHLLQAVCGSARDGAQFVPVRALGEAGPDILEGLASQAFVCLDDVDSVAGKREWEFALFGLANALADSGGVLLCSAASAPRESGFALADLVSRFSRLPAFHLKALDDADLMSALQLRARHRGLDLPDDTASFLLTRSKRDMSSLYELLDKLDGESLKAQRRLTIPFVRDVMNVSSRREA